MPKSISNRDPWAPSARIDLFLSCDSNGLITQKQYWKPDAEANYFDDSETLIEENFSGKKGSSYFKLSN